VCLNNSTLPSVSYVKADGLLDGHPASSKVDFLEGMVEKIVNHLNANPPLFASTARITTTDEGGGYYDSGCLPRRPSSSLHARTQGVGDAFRPPQTDPEARPLRLRGLTGAHEFLLAATAQNLRRMSRWLVPRMEEALA
jgi:phospholipase C